MPWNEQQTGLNLGDNTQISSEYFFKDIIIDRGSRYSVFASPLTNIEQVKIVYNELRKKDYFKNATHNSYAYRVKNESSSIQEGKNDDGETGAGMCILRELQRAEAINMLVVVTRYFGGTHLQADRFKHVINSVKILFEKIRNSSN